MHISDETTNKPTGSPLAHISSTIIADAQPHLPAEVAGNADGAVVDTAAALAGAADLLQLLLELRVVGLRGGARAGSGSGSGAVALLRVVLTALCMEWDKRAGTQICI